MADNTDTSAGDAQAIQMLQAIHPNADTATIQGFLSDLRAAGDDPAAANAVVNKYLTSSSSAPTPPTVQTQLPDTYAGAGYNQTDLLKQFNPAQLRAAQAAQADAYQRMQPWRAAGSAFVANTGNEGLMNSNRADWANTDKQVELQTLGAQKALQGQATEGLAAGTVAQNQNKTAGEYTLSQGKGAQELAQAAQKTSGGALTLKNQQDLNNPNSPQTMLAKQILMNQLKSDPSLANNPELKSLLTRGDITAQQLMAFMKPEVLDAYKTKVGITQTQAETGKTIEDTNKVKAEIPGIAAESQVKQGVANTVAPMPPAPVVPTPPYVGNAGRGSQGVSNEGANANPVFNFKPGTDLRAARAVLAKSQGPEVLAAFDKQYPDVAASTQPVLHMPAGSNMSVSAGGATISPSPATTGGQTAAAAEDATNRAQSKVASQYGLENLTGSLAQRSADAVAKGKVSATGNMGTLMANYTPGEAERLRTDINNLVDAKIAYGTAAGSNPIKDRDAEIARIMKLSPSAFQNEVLSTNQQIVRQGARAQAQSQYIAQNGTATGFDDSKIANATYMFNPATGANALVNPAKVDQYRKQGFKPLNELNR